MKRLIACLVFIGLLGIPLYLFSSESVFLSSSAKLIPGTNITFDESVPGVITVNASSSSLPSGLIVMWSGLLTNIPSGWQLCDGTNGTPDLRDKFIKGTSAGQNPGATGGSSTYTPQGTVSQPTFSGNALAAHQHGVGTYANTGISAGTPSGTISWPVSVPTNSTVNFTPSGSNGTSTVTPLGTITWPAGVPIFSGSALPTHQHEIPFTFDSGTVLGRTAGYGTGSSIAKVAQATTSTNTTSVAVQKTQGVSGGTPAGTIAWPGGVPIFSGSLSTVAAQIFTGSQGVIPAETISWPVSVPSFSGSVLPSHNHVFSGSSESVSGGTPSGTVSQPSFTGTQATVEPTYFKLAFIMKL